MATVPKSPPPAVSRKADAPAPRRRVKPATTLPAQAADGSRDHPLWHEVARLCVLFVAALVLVLIVRGSNQVHTLTLALFGWLAYLVPVVLALLGLDLLRRRSSELPLLRVEEATGIALMFAALVVALAGAGQDGGYVGATLADGLRSLGGTAVVVLGAAGLMALGGVLTFHLSSQDIVDGAVRGLRIAGRGLLRVLQLLLVVARRAARALSARAARGSVQQPAALSQQAPLALPAEASQRRFGLGRIVQHPAADRPAPTTPLPPSPQDPAGWTRLAPTAQPDVTARPAPATAPTKTVTISPAARSSPDTSSNGPAAPAGGGRPARQTPAPSASTWPQPSLNLLQPVVARPGGPVDNDMRRQIIEDTLLSFNVKAMVVDAHTGPTVTQFDLQPDRGVRVQRITALANDLALALASPGAIRIEAPVPGRPVVGLQVPNSSTSTVSLREIIESDAFARSQARSPLTIALGKDVAGHPVVADLTKMPHLLIAGATGSGKSVCLNSLIACLLFHNNPDRLRLLMVDPKMVELTPFNGVPHLLAPVVTDVEKVPNTLKWALREMKDRYTKFTAAGVRNIAGYNAAQPDEASHLPYIVIIIDELADLMMVAPEEVEDHICRLAQLARATGIHLVIATQRPSVDVITGLIKANFPSRIAFAVSSQVDSRTIMDVAGAEKLMGRGDMLYMAADASKPQRVQGAFLEEREIEDLVKFWTYNAPAAPSQIPPEVLDAPKEDPDESAAEEKLLDEAARVVREYNRASVSLLQRRLSIGYSRAARVLDQLEERGVVGPSHDGRSRLVILSPSDVIVPGTQAQAGGGSAVATDDDDPPF